MLRKKKGASSSAALFPLSNTWPRLRSMSYKYRNPSDADKIFSFKSNSRDFYSCNLFNCLKGKSIDLLDEELKEYRLFLDLRFEGNNLWASLICDRSSYNGRGPFIRYEIALLDAQSTVDLIRKGSWNFATSGNNEHVVSICEKDYILKHSRRLSHDGTLSISLMTSIVQDKKPAKKWSLARENLFNYYKNLHDESKDSDIILAVGSKEIPAHKSILAARSPVFKAMFSSSFKEATSNRVEITDIDPEVLEEVIRFIYTSECPRIEEIPMEMLAAADKYDIESLKLFCEEVLLEQLDSRNAVDLLLLALLGDRHSATVLKKKAIDLIRRDKNINRNKIKLIGENSERLSEILFQD